MGAVNDSMEQEGDYASTAGAERKNCFCIKEVICEHVLPRFALPSPELPPANAGRRSGVSILL
ncbi:hypothetical protein GXR09_002460 [Salmonella enterica]|nr:hypothetical protein [Salmonella enterica]